MKTTLSFIIAILLSTAALTAQAKNCVVRCKTPFSVGNQVFWGPANFRVYTDWEGDLYTTSIANEPCLCKGWASDVPVISCPNPASNAYYGGARFEYISCPYDAHRTTAGVSRLPACMAEFNRIVNQGGDCGR